MNRPWSFRLFIKKNTSSADLQKPKQARAKSGEYKKYQNYEAVETTKTLLELSLKPQNWT